MNGKSSASTLAEFDSEALITTAADAEEASYMKKALLVTVAELAPQHNTSLELENTVAPVVTSPALYPVADTSVLEAAVIAADKVSCPFVLPSVVEAAIIFLLKYLHH